MENKTNKKKKIRGIMLLAGLALVVVVICICIHINKSVSSKNNHKNAVSVSQGADVTNARDIHTGMIPGLNKTLLNNLEKRESENTAAPSKSKFSTMVGTKGTIKAKTPDLNLLVGNAKGNLHNSYFTISANGECLYTSAIMKPNTYVNHEKLYNSVNHQKQTYCLIAGNYPATIKQFVISDNGKPLACYETNTIIVCS